MTKPRQAWLLALLTLALVAGQFALQSHLSYSLMDEGFLHYGAQRVLKGEVPMRDFMSYEPLRYYFTALWMWIAGSPGVLAMRVSLFVTEWLALLLLLGTLQLRRDRNGFFLGCAILTAMLWMTPHHKVFDMLASIGLAFGFTRLVSNPRLRNYLVAGLCIGLAGSIGKNHALYGLLGGCLVCVYLRFRLRDPNFARGFLAAVVGGILGYMPVLLMVAFVPGFSAAFTRSVSVLFQNGATNLGVPVPWPWSVHLQGLQPSVAVSTLFTGCLFLLVIGFAFFSLFLVYRGKGKDTPPALIGAAVLAIPYAHYAFSRADVAHLAQGIFPLLICAFVLIGELNPKAQSVAASCALGISLLTLSPQQPVLDGRLSGLKETTILGDKLYEDPQTWETMELLKKLTALYAPNDSTFLVEPLWPGSYAMMNRRAPVWEVYPFFPRSRQFQLEEIERIQRADPGFVLIADIPLDGKQTVFFESTNSVTFRYIAQHFKRLEVPSSDPRLKLYVAAPYSSTARPKPALP